MYSVDSLEYAVRHLFQGGIGEHGYSEEEVETLLHGCLLYTSDAADD